MSNVSGKSMVKPNPELFKLISGALLIKEDEYTSVLGCGETKWKELCKGKKVSIVQLQKTFKALRSTWNRDDPTSKKIAAKLKEYFGDEDKMNIRSLVIFPDPLPADPDKYLGLQHGVFADQGIGGELQWNEESLKLELKSNSDGWLRFSGTIMNQKGIEFDVDLSHRKGGKRASLVARIDEDVWFCATFGTFHLLGKQDWAFAGIWDGLHMFGTYQAVFRIILSTRELSIDDRRDILKAAPVFSGLR